MMKSTKGRQCKQLTLSLVITHASHGLGYGKTDMCEESILMFC